MFISKKPQKSNPVFLIFQDNSLRKNYINVKIDNKKWQNLDHLEIEVNI